MNQWHWLCYCNTLIIFFIFSLSHNQDFRSCNIPKLPTKLLQIWLENAKWSNLKILNISTKKNHLHKHISPHRCNDTHPFTIWITLWWRGGKKKTVHIVNPARHETLTAADGRGGNRQYQHHELMFQDRQLGRDRSFTALFSSACVFHLSV